MKKKKILLLSDDLRMHSGVATQSKEMVIGTIGTYDWVQIAAAINHPEKGQIVDMSEALSEEYKIKNGYLKIYPTSGYGNPDILREILHIEKPDAILHFTDPRQWIWLYEMEHELRQHIPIMYYNIWDDLPDPKYNRYYYKSCDLLMSISKQTYGINKRVLSEDNYDDWQLKYVPHGIDPKVFFKIDAGDTRFKHFEAEHGLDEYDFKILYLNRNIRRKQPNDVMLAFKHFVDQLPLDKRDKCCLIYHTQVVDDHGTDLKAVHEHLMPDYNVVFTQDVQPVFDPQQMNFIYNSADVYINLASNEGFGLGSAEALMAETPIIVNVTGGLQDQCGFKKEDGTYLTADDYIELQSNHRGKYKEHGEWAKPVFPSNISCQGSPLTPYIFDDRVQYEDAGNAMKYWYDKTIEERSVAGQKGREFMLSNDARLSSPHLAQNTIDSINTVFEKWKPRKKYTLEVV
jgi:glycosyltransferase involved in cell wall biosynthesis